MSIVRQVIGWGEGCYWDLRLKAGFETPCCMRVGVFVCCGYGSGGFQAAFLFEVSSAAAPGLLCLCRVLPQLEQEVTHGGESGERWCLLTSTAVQQSSGFPSATSPLGDQTATVLAGQGGAGCCQCLRPGVCRGFPLTGVPALEGHLPVLPQPSPWLQWWGRHGLRCEQDGLRALTPPSCLLALRPKVSVHGRETLQTCA